MPEPKKKTNLPEHQPADHESAKDAPKPFKPRCVVLTPPDGQPISIGYVDGVQMPKKKSGNGRAE